MVGRGKDRDGNVRFMASHYLYEPEFCHPASGSEGTSREECSGCPLSVLSTEPTLASLEALNDWLELRKEIWQQTPHRTMHGTIADL